MEQEHLRSLLEWLRGIIQDFLSQICSGVCLILCILALGCGGGTSGQIKNPPPAVSVIVSPENGTVLLGNSLPFSATVQNSTNTSVTWSVNGVADGDAVNGTISSSGIYAAPADLPANAAVRVSATSVADPTKSASAQITIVSDISLSLQPGASNVELGSVQPFHATLTSSGHPDTTLHWSLSGASCPQGCGSVDANGNFAAPQILPSSPQITLIVQSAADPSRRASSTVQLTSSFTMQISAPTQIATGQSAAIVATILPVPGSNPSSSISWSVSGWGCTGTGCGSLVPISAAAGVPVYSSSANYTAPGTVPNPNIITITAASQADMSKKAQATLSIQSGTGISLTPQQATIAANHRLTLSAQTSGETGTNISWTVNGIAGGNAAVGKICAVESNPCQVPIVNATQVDYMAPGSIPALNPVSVDVSSPSNSSQFAEAKLTVINHVNVSVQPGSVTLAPLAVQGFSASVLGSTNQNVTWQVQGCSSGIDCGSITQNGVYTAPGSPPPINSPQVIAISADDTTQSGAANITISAGASILSLHPASVYQGEANGFTLRANGSGFVSSTSNGTVLWIGGAPRITSCANSNECSAPVFASDTSRTGNLSVQAQNPDGTRSNSANLVVAAPNSSDDSIALTSTNPQAIGKDIVVVEPTTAGISTDAADLDLNIVALGNFSVANNSCTLAGNPIDITRPSSGSSAVDICVFAQAGLDTSMSYIISGSGDISVVAKQPAGLGIVHLTLQVPANALIGARTLFIQNTNLDKTAASGVLEVY